MRGKYLNMLVNTATRTEMPGTTYYIDGNSGIDTNTGKSWAQAFKTLAVGFAASHADIARGSDRWARRNTVYIAGDRFVETLIIAPQKTDIIGVGSCDNFHSATIRGNHAPVNAATGTRWINVHFEPTTAADIMTLTNASTGMEFINCEFRAVGAATAASAIDATDHTWLKIIGCEFNGGFTDDVIDIGEGSIDGLVIKDNTIMGAAQDGIIVTGTTDITTGRMGLIANNLIKCNNVGIDDGADSTIAVIGNRIVTAGALGGTSHVITVAFACDNIVTGAGVQKCYPTLTGVTT